MTERLFRRLTPEEYEKLSLEERIEYMRELVEQVRQYVEKTRKQIAERDKRLHPDK